MVNVKELLDELQYFHPDMNVYVSIPDKDDMYEWGIKQVKLVKHGRGKIILVLNDEGYYFINKKRNDVDGM